MYMGNPEDVKPERVPEAFTAAAVPESLNVLPDPRPPV
jgi:hypothetical protein